MGTYSKSLNLFARTRFCEFGRPLNPQPQEALALGFGVWGLGFWSLGFRVLGFGVQGFRVWGLGF